MVLSHAISRPHERRDADPHRPAPAGTLSRPDGPHEGNPSVRTAIKNKEPQHIAWAVERDDGGRGFGFTGSHFHWNWSDPNFRKLVLNAIAWCAKVNVPPGGVPDKPKTMADMEANHDEIHPRISTAKQSEKSSTCRLTNRY